MTPSGGVSTRFTIDTNLLVYSVDGAAGIRHALAGQKVTRKGIMPAAEAAAQTGDWLLLFTTVAVSASAIRAALADAVAGRASYWDALLVATAAEAGCRLILTEDLADGGTLGGVEIHNPFDGAGGLTARARALLGI